MSLPKPPSRRHFTAAAQAAAIEARRRKRDLAKPRGTPELFVVRLGDERLPFGWEIRRFGAVVIDRGPLGFSTADAARSAGEEALSAAEVGA
ncbi:hypothetical protein [Lichenibacterium dinghuense]|uniref:hypothetical protein n=1 Tax=Lichenibacterium dinghuense TaxID=2895977 RepID=UPI001F2C4332|nr:hypothetical protein [Lichenibacterium sp. 6Y81]